jgi:hypothetical protein
MIRWALLLATLLSFGLVIAGFVGHVRKMYPTKINQSDMKQGKTPAYPLLVSLSASIDSSGVLYNRTRLAAAVDTPSVLSDISQAEGQPLNGPDGLSRARWKEMIGRTVVWRGRLEEGARVFEETKYPREIELDSREEMPFETETQRWFFGPVQGEKGFFAIYLPFIVPQAEDSPDLIQKLKVRAQNTAPETIDHWQHQHHLLGKLYKPADAPIHVPWELKTTLSTFSQDDCWLIVTDLRKALVDYQSGYYAYLPIPESQTYVQVPLTDFYRDKWKENGLQGVWLPAGQHGFHPIDPRTKRPLPGNFALFITGSKAPGDLIYGPWWQEPTSLLVVTGAGLFAGISLVLLIGIVVG